MRLPSVKNLRDGHPSTDGSRNLPLELTLRTPSAAAAASTAALIYVTMRSLAAGSLAAAGHLSKVTRRTAFQHLEKSILARSGTRD